MTAPPPADTAIELAPDEWDAVSLFFSLETQWRHGGMAGERLGLDYGAIEPVARILKLELTPALLGDLRTLERAALDQFAVRP